MSFWHRFAEIDQVVDAVRPVDPGAPRADRQVPPAAQRLRHQEDVAHPLPLVLALTGAVWREPQGQNGDVVRTVAGVVVEEGMAEPFGGLAGVLCGEPGQGGQALGEGVLVVFDEAVGEEDDAGAAGELMLQVRAGSLGVDAEGQPRLCIEVPSRLPGQQEQRGRVARGAPVQEPPHAGRPQAGKADGGEGVSAMAWSVRSSWVGASDGTITVTGHIETWGEHDAVIDAAWRGMGVRNVRDDLVITG
jgi:hypothetical protein